MKQIISALDIPCTLCGADKGERCRAMNDPNLDHWLSFVVHPQRSFDANDATRALNTLLDDDD